MPLPLLAHQAPVLPLKLWWPAAFNGTALVIGSIAPDLEYIVDNGTHAAGFGHTFGAQLYVWLPLTVLVVLLVGYLRLGEVVATRLTRLRWLTEAATDVTKQGGLRRACVSALCGSFSHLGLDALTHTVVPSWLPLRVFHFGPISAGTPTLVQLIASTAGVLVSLWVLRQMSLQNARIAPVRRSGAWVLVLFATAGMALALRQALPAIRHPGWYFDAGKLYVWGHTAFFIACGLVGGVIVGAVPLALRDRRTPSV